MRVQHQRVNITWTHFKQKNLGFSVTVRLMLLLCVLFNYTHASSESDSSIIAGDAQFERYLPLLQHQRVAVCANNASAVAGLNIVLQLQQRGIKVRKIFSPEHGFLGTNAAGAKVANTMLNNIAIISLYGTHDKPTQAELADVDIIVYDLQDVGVRYYTYISTLQKLMEAAITYAKPLLILDRPNPNGFYIDGPILEEKYKSFVGMQAIPLVYGMTSGEYAKMLVGEQWLDLDLSHKAQQLQLTIIPVINYNHQSKYQLDLKPSPNLPNMSAVYWYPSLGLFEGSQLSIGRGTAMPFQVIGHPAYKQEFSFVPHAEPYATEPRLAGQLCHGWDLRMSASQVLLKLHGQLDLSWLINSYQQFPCHDKFFTPFFDQLAGTASLRQQIIAGFTESQIRASWQEDLSKFKTIRQKYLLYSES